MTASVRPSAAADPLAILKGVFGYPAFRGHQADIVSHVAAGHNALVLIPTGGGKSLCYQVPALARDGVGVVVSPLIALMQDQVAALRARGVRAALLNSTLTPHESAEIERQVRTGDLKFLYLAPERLVNERTLSLLGASRLALFAIDEAHCISEWGHDFRPEYLRLSVLHERFPAVPRIALTATADALTRTEIATKLALTDARKFESSFDRPNIRYRIVEKHDAHKQLLRFIRKYHGGDAGVVYCQTRGKVEETAAFLAASGIEALPYHAGLSPAERNENQAWFLRRRGVVMVATIAFGMGIDKADVRFVVHLDVPKSVEGYYQESGRAGRDGLPSVAWMTYSPEDAKPLYEMIRRSPASEAHKRIQESKLDAMIALCETAVCRRTRLLSYFGEASMPCGNCDTCYTPPRTYDATRAMRQVLWCVSVTGARSIAEHAAHLSKSSPGRKRTADEWRAIIREGIAAGLLAVNHAEGSVLRRTRASAAVIDGRQRVTLRALHAAKRAKRPERTLKFAADGGPAVEALFDALRRWRLGAARKRRIPAHLVFHDAVLTAIALARPGSRWALRRIRGVGTRKAAEFGEELLQLTTRGG